MGGKQVSIALHAKRHLHKSQSTFETHKRHINHHDDFQECILSGCNAAANATRRRETELQQPAKNDVLGLLSDLKSCGRKRDLQEGRRVHRNAIVTGNDSNIYVATAVINMYAKCSSMVEARWVFDGIEQPNVVSWNTLILGYAENEQSHAALELFSRMKGECVPNSVTYLAAIKACTSLAASEDQGVCLTRGREIHSDIGHNMNHFVQSTLINMYAKCGSMGEALRVFDNIKEPNVVSCTALILGYADNGEGKAALDFFVRMKSVHRCAPNAVTYLVVIKACMSLAMHGDGSVKEECLKRGREIHLEIGCHLTYFVQSALISMYAKCGSTVDAQQVFDNIEEPDLVSWNALILGYAENGEGQTALDLFSRMKNASRWVPDSATYVAAIKACGAVGALSIGRKFHVEITDFNVHVVTCLVDFYAKWGSMVEAREVFETHSKARNIKTWNALLSGYGSYGDIGSVFNLFKAMQDQGFRPDVVTFVCILSCCSHAGLVDKARGYLEAMPVQYGVTPTVMHYNCMIDVFGRVNQLDEAVALLQKMPCNPDIVTWKALLGVCCKWKNVEIGRLAFQSLVNLDEKNAVAYVFMAQIYGSRGMWKEQDKVLETRRKFGAWKQLEQAYVMDGMGKMVKFVVGEEDPPEVKDKLRQFVKEHVFAEWYMNSGVEDSEEEVVCGHSERRAVVYGLLNTPHNEPIRAFKNMKMCDSCHWATKSLSNLCHRIIIVKDDSLFHFMENGNCSCGE